MQPDTQGGRQPGGLHVPQVSRVLPGPAGKLQELAAAGTLQQATPEVLGLRASSMPGVSASQIANQHDAAFLSSSWAAAQAQAADDEVIAGPVRSIKSAKELGVGKLTRMLVVMSTFQPSGAGSAFSKVKDPSGSMGAAIHSSALQQERQLGPGCVLLLQQVSVLTPNPGSSYLALTADNIVQVWPPDQPGRNIRHAAHQPAATQQQQQQQQQTVGQQQQQKSPGEHHQQPAWQQQPPPAVPGQFMMGQHGRQQHPAGQAAASGADSRATSSLFSPSSPDIQSVLNQMTGQGPNAAVYAPHQSNQRNCNKQQRQQQPGVPPAGFVEPKHGSQQQQQQQQQRQFAQWQQQGPAQQPEFSPALSGAGGAAHQRGVPHDGSMRPPPPRLHNSTRQFQQQQASQQWQQQQLQGTSQQQAPSQPQQQWQQQQAQASLLQGLSQPTGPDATGKTITYPAGAGAGAGAGVGAGVKLMQRPSVSSGAPSAHHQAAGLGSQPAAPTPCAKAPYAAVNAQTCDVRLAAGSRIQGSTRSGHRTVSAGAAAVGAAAGTTAVCDRPAGVLHAAAVAAGGDHDEEDVEVDENIVAAIFGSQVGGARTKPTQQQQQQGPAPAVTGVIRSAAAASSSLSFPGINTAGHSSSLLQKPPPGAGSTPAATWPRRPAGALAAGTQGGATPATLQARTVDTQHQQQQQQWGVPGSMQRKQQQQPGVHVNTPAGQGPPGLGGFGASLLGKRPAGPVSLLDDLVADDLDDLYGRRALGT